MIREVEQELGGAHFWNELADDDVTGRVTRYAKTHGPFTADQLIADLHLDATDAVHTLDVLAAKGELLQGHFVDDDEQGQQWLHKDVFRRIRSRSLAKARKAVKPVESEAFQMFLIDRQGIGPVGGERYEGADGLMRVIEQLEAYHCPLHSGSRQYSRTSTRLPTALLDELLTSGDVVWVGSKPGEPVAMDPGEVAFYPADSILFSGVEHGTTSTPQTPPCRKRF